MQPPVSKKLGIIILMVAKFLAIKMDSGSNLATSPQKRLGPPVEPQLLFFDEMNDMKTEDKLAIDDLVVVANLANAPFTIDDDVR